MSAFKTCVEFVFSYSTIRVARVLDLKGEILLHIFSTLNQMSSINYVQFKNLSRNYV